MLKCIRQKRMKIIILMSTYNGTKYLREQLDSIYNLDNIGDISILVRDDGSKDGTQDILEEYKRSHDNFDWYQGENLRPARSFWQLMKVAPDADFYAYADQDDVWDKDKLVIATKALEPFDKKTPLLYFSDVRVVRADLSLMYKNMIQTNMPIDFPHSLIKNVCPGCTYVFNKAARDIALKFDPDIYELDIHDWAMHRIVACFGHIVLDRTAHMSYRQHGNNVIGANRNGIFGRIIETLKKSKNPKFVNLRLRNARAFEECYANDMNPENRYTVYLLAHYIEDKNLMKAVLKDPRFKFGFMEYTYFKWRIHSGKF